MKPISAGQYSQKYTGRVTVLCPKKPKPEVKAPDAECLDLRLLSNTSLYYFKTHFSVIWFPFFPPQLESKTRRHITATASWDDCEDMFQ